MPLLTFETLESSHKNTDLRPSRAYMTGSNPSWDHSMVVKSPPNH